MKLLEKLCIIFSTCRTEIMTKILGKKMIKMIKIFVEIEHLFKHIIYCDDVVTIFFD